MFRIGEFSRIARVSCRLLRHYEELGLIAPARTDPDTAYRYYSAAQLPQLNRILVLRELGFSLEEIGRMVRDGVSAAELRGMLALRRAQAARSVEAEEQRLRRIESHLAQLETDGRVESDDVLVRAEPERRLISFRRTLPSFAEGVRTLGMLAARKPRGAEALVAIAHSAEFEPDSIDVEFGFFVSDAAPQRLVLEDGTELGSRMVPAVERLACCVRLGPPQEAHRVTARIGRYVEARGERLSGPNRELFLQWPDPARMQESVVEMQFPVEGYRRSGAAPTDPFS